MTNVSKKKLDEKLSLEIWQQLHEAIGKLSASQASPFLDNLLTQSEQIMLAKRLAAIVLVHEKHSGYAIAKTLNMSNATIKKLRLRYDNKEFTAVLTGLKKNRNDYLEFVETLLTVIHVGLPRYAGPGRNNFLKH